MVKTQVFLGRNDAECVGVPHASPPALYTDDWIALAKHTKLDRVHDTPLEAAVNILLPWLGLEVWLLFGEIEWVNAAVQVRILIKLVREIFVFRGNLP